ncbi:MAG: helix-turn-helix transcriptional regulator [Lachnospiraceae bacterium]|nr:helix-turn-helix transcriptional regulator [Lachnospiraceae bacterium]
MRFSQKVREARRQAGMTQRQLAEACGISLRTLTNYETGRSFPRSEEQLRRLAQALGIEESYLRAGEDISALKWSKDSPCAKRAQGLIEDFTDLMYDDMCGEYEKDVLLCALQKIYWEAKGIL